MIVSVLGNHDETIFIRLVVNGGGILYHICDKCFHTVEFFALPAGLKYVGKMIRVDMAPAIFFACLFQADRSND